MSPLGDHMTRKDDKGDQSSYGETTWTNTGATRFGRGLHEINWRRHAEASPSHGTIRLPNDDDDDDDVCFTTFVNRHVAVLGLNSQLYT